MNLGQALEDPLTRNSESDIYLTPVVFRSRTLHESALFETVDQADSAVVLDEEMVRQLAYRRRAVEAVNGKQELVLLRLQALLPGR